MLSRPASARKWLRGLGQSTLAFTLDTCSRVIPGKQEALIAGLVFAGKPAVPLGPAELGLAGGPRGKTLVLYGKPAGHPCSP